MKKLLRDTEGKSGLEYLLIVAAIGTVGAVPFWAFGTGMDSAISGNTVASTLPTLGGQAMAHTANDVEGMCYVQTFADNGSNGEANATRVGADIRASGINDVYVTQNQNGYYVTRIRVSCDAAESVLNDYNGLGITNDAYVGNLPKSDDALFNGEAPPPVEEGPDTTSEPEQPELPFDEEETETVFCDDIPEGHTGGCIGSSADVGSNAQAGEGLPEREVSNSPVQRTLNEIYALSDDELEGLLSQEGITPNMEALLDASDDPESLYYLLLSEAANELTYREFAAFSDEDLTQSLTDYQMILEECTALSPTPAFTEDNYPAVNESCQNESGQQFIADFEAAMTGVETEEAYYQAMETFAGSDIAAQCWAVQDQPQYDEQGLMIPTDACAGNETKLSAFNEAQLNGEAVMYTLERRNFEDIFGADAYEGSHSLKLLEYDENDQLVRSERLFREAENLGLLEPGSFEAAIAEDQAMLDQATMGEQPELAATDGGDEGDGCSGGIFGFVCKAANWVGDKVPLNETFEWIANLGGDIPVIDQITDVIGGTLRLSNVINPIAWVLEPADTFNFAKNLTIGVGKEFWDMGTGLAFGLIGDVGYNWFVKEGIMGGFGLLDGGQFWKSAGNFAVKTPGALWNMGKNILGTAYTAVDGSQSIDDQAQALGRTGAFIGTVWVGGATAATKLGKLARNSRVAQANAKLAPLADDAVRSTGYAARAAEVQSNMIARGASQHLIDRAGHLRSSFTSRADAFSKAERVAMVEAKAPTLLGRTRIGMRVGDRAAGPIQALYNNRVFNAPTRAWDSFANGLQGTSSRVLRATGTPQVFGAARRGAAQWAASPQLGWMWRHPYAYAAGSPVYKSGARKDNSDYYIGAAKDMVKMMSEGGMPGGRMAAGAPQ